MEQIPNPESQEEIARRFLESIESMLGATEGKFKSRQFWDKESHQCVRLAVHAKAELDKLAHANLSPEDPMQYPRQETEYVISHRNEHLSIDKYVREVKTSRLSLLGAGDDGHGLTSPRDEALMKEHAMEALDFIKDIRESEALERGMGFTKVSDEEIAEVMEMIKRLVPYREYLKSPEA